MYINYDVSTNNYLTLLLHNTEKLLINGISNWNRKAAYHWPEKSYFLYKSLKKIFRETHYAVFQSSIASNEDWHN